MCNSKFPLEIFLMAAPVPNLSLMTVVKNPEVQKNLLWLNGAIPGFLLAYDWLKGNLGANPPEAFIRSTGMVAIIFLVLATAVTPLSQQFKWSWIIKHRRWLGLWSFYYGCLHFLGSSYLEQGLDIAIIGKDILKRPFILLGFMAFLCMVPLAITSSNGMIKRMGGKKWKSLHKLTYAIAILAAIHYWMIVKSDVFYPALFAGLFAVFLSFRIIKNLTVPSKSKI